MMTNAAYSAIQFNCSMAAASRASGRYTGYVLHGTRNRAGGRTLCRKRDTSVQQQYVYRYCYYFETIRVPPLWTHVLLCESSCPALPEHLSCRRNLRTRRLVCRDASVDCAVYGAVVVAVRQYWSSRNYNNNMCRRRHYVDRAPGLILVGTII